MSFTYDDTNRQVVPRCLTYETACSLGLLRINRKQELLNKEKITDSDTKKEWIENPSIISAVDLVGEALLIKDFQSSDAIKAAEYILNKAPESRLLIKQLASHFLERPLKAWSEPNEPTTQNASRKEIAKIKRSVRYYPENPLAWSDLSLSYATLGQTDKAKKAMQVAMNLAKNNRFILRSASRCFMHLGEPDKAVEILNKSGLCAIDPWIASAEIAISQSVGLKSKCLGKAKDLIENENLSSFSRSELALGVGTLELKSGATRKAKKIIRNALKDPTENALAQTQWAASTFKISFDDLVGLRTTVPASYEATAVYSYYNKAFTESLKASEKWGKFQFLSARPIIQSMFISSSMLNNDLGAVNIFNNAFPAQKESPLAINNYAFALARIGRIDEAKEALKKAVRYEVSREDKLTMTATIGLICFREGFIEKGREYYSNAINGFEFLRDFRSAVMARYYLAVEEKRINSQNAKLKIMEAKREIERHNVFDFIDLAKSL